MGLTNKQKAFVIEYVKDFNATQSAIRAGYSEVSARYIGYENLQKPHIREKIDSYFQENAMSASEVISHLSDLARGVIEGGDVGSRIRALDTLAKYHQLTTTTQVRTWKDDAIEAIKNGEIDYQGFMNMFDDESLANQLFMQAGVPIAD